MVQYSKIANLKKNQKSKIYKSKISKTWREKREKILDITIQIGLFLQSNIRMKRLVH